jgi:hypothetical protein
MHFSRKIDDITQVDVLCRVQKEQQRIGNKINEDDFYEYYSISVMITEYTITYYPAPNCVIMVQSLDSEKKISPQIKPNNKFNPKTFMNFCVCEIFDFLFYFIRYCLEVANIFITIIPWAIQHPWVLFIQILYFALNYFIESKKK